MTVEKGSEMSVNIYQLCTGVHMRQVRPRFNMLAPYCDMKISHDGRYMALVSGANMALYRLDHHIQDSIQGMLDMWAQDPHIWDKYEIKLHSNQHVITPARAKIISSLSFNKSGVRKPQWKEDGTSLANLNKEHRA